MNPEISDRLVWPEDIVPCPEACQDEYVHRHLRDGTTQWAYRGFGIDQDGNTVRGPKVRK